MKAEEFKKKVPIDLEGMVLGKLRVTKGNVEGVVLLDKAGNKTHILRFDKIWVEPYW